MFRAFICSSSGVQVVTTAFGIPHCKRKYGISGRSVLFGVSRSNWCRLRGLVYWNKVLRIVLTGVGGTVRVRWGCGAIRLFTAYSTKTPRLNISYLKRSLA
jgi:hypothetical protein